MIKIVIKDNEVTGVLEYNDRDELVNELEIGKSVKGKGPNGLFVFPINNKPLTINHLFIAGGIGITPFRSFIKYNIDKNLHIPMHLVFSNSDDEFVFKKELDKWSTENDYIKIDYMNTSVEGRLDKEKMSSLVSNQLVSSIFSVVGPPAFVTAIEKILEELNFCDKGRWCRNGFSFSILCPKPRPVNPPEPTAISDCCIW